MWKRVGETDLLLQRAVQHVEELLQRIHLVHERTNELHHIPCVLLDVEVEYMRAVLLS